MCVRIRIRVRMCTYIYMCTCTCVTSLHRGCTKLPYATVQSNVSRGITWKPPAATIQCNVCKYSFSVYRKVCILQSIPPTEKLWVDSKKSASD